MDDPSALLLSGVEEGALRALFYVRVLARRKRAHHRLKRGEQRADLSLKHSKGRRIEIADARRCPLQANACLLHVLLERSEPTGARGRRRRHGSLLRAGHQPRNGALGTSASCDRHALRAAARLSAVLISGLHRARAAHWRAGEKAPHLAGVSPWVAKNALLKASRLADGSAQRDDRLKQLVAVARA